MYSSPKKMILGLVKIHIQPGLKPIKTKLFKVYQNRNIKPMNQKL